MLGGTTIQWIEVRYEKTRLSKLIVIVIQQILSYSLPLGENSFAELHIRYNNLKCRNTSINVTLNIKLYKLDEI